MDSNTTSDQDNAFGLEFLEDICDWIGENIDAYQMYGAEALSKAVHEHEDDFAIADCFTDQAIKDYVESKFYINQIFDDDEILRYVKQHFNISEIFQGDAESQVKYYLESEYTDPEDVFSKDKLAAWAEDHGYEKI